MDTTSLSGDGHTVLVVRSGILQVKGVASLLLTPVLVPDTLTAVPAAIAAGALDIFCVRTYFIVEAINQ